MKQTVHFLVNKIHINQLFVLYKNIHLNQDQPIDGYQF